MVAVAQNKRGSKAASDAATSVLESAAANNPELFEAPAGTEDKAKETKDKSMTDDNQNQNIPGYENLAPAQQQWIDQALDKLADSRKLSLVLFRGFRDKVAALADDVTELQELTGMTSKPEPVEKPKRQYNFKTPKIAEDKPRRGRKPGSKNKATAAKPAKASGSALPEATKAAVKKLAEEAGKMVGQRYFSSKLNNAMAIVNQLVDSGEMKARGDGTSKKFGLA